MFSEEELRVLKAEITQHEIELFGKANIRYATKWPSIVEKVNDVGFTRRTVNQMTKRWQDQRRQNKSETRNAVETGGLPSISQLTPLERQAERTIHP
ncbi:UNVERIFIED_CONTAM: hypothetical protein FKN15_029763 [Acipenser sinensis]